MVFGEHDVAGRHAGGDRVEQRADHPGPRGGGGDLGGGRDNPGTGLPYSSAQQAGSASAHARIARAITATSARQPSGPAPGPFDAVGQVGVRVGEQHREQLVAPGDIAVHRRRHHAEVTGDGPDGQTGGALGRQLPAAQAMICA